MEIRGTLTGLRNHFEFLHRNGQGGGQLHFEDTAICRRSPFFSCRSSRCILMQFVPEEFRSTNTPCRHIPLTATGESLTVFYSTRTFHDTDLAVKSWLLSMIERLESAASEGSDGNAA
jgi:hypothetical protein